MNHEPKVNRIGPWIMYKAYEILPKYWANRVINGLCNVAEFEIVNTRITPPIDILRSPENQ
jgi:hypothetical protein